LRYFKRKWEEAGQKKRNPSPYGRGTQPGGNAGQGKGAEKLSLWDKGKAENEDLPLEAHRQATRETGAMLRGKGKKSFGGKPPQTKEDSS